jgi:ribonucleoside-diphosphate reductase alpha chain
MSFAPSGITDDPEIRTASSLVDYVFRRLAMSYLSFDDRLELGLASFEDMPEAQTSLLEVEPTEAPTIVVEQPAVEAVTVPVTEQKSDTAAATASDTAPLCYNCGNQTQRAGSCYVCTSCGSTTGCS